MKVELKLRQGGAQIASRWGWGGDFCTDGAMIGSSAPVQLPNSKLSITIGPSQAIIPDTNDYFEEYRGFYPDLWVPAGEGEELAVKLLEQNAQ